MWCLCDPKVMLQRIRIRESHCHLKERCTMNNKCKSILSCATCKQTCDHKLFCTIEFRFPELYWFLYYFENWVSSSDTFEYSLSGCFLNYQGAGVYLFFFFFFPYQIGVTVICPNSYATNVFSYVIQGLKEERIIAIV